MNDDSPNFQHKCQQYWPSQMHTTEIQGKFNITVTSFVPCAEYQVRKMQLKSVSLSPTNCHSIIQCLQHKFLQYFVTLLHTLDHPCLMLLQTSDPEHELTVTHMFYTAWPDHGVPRNAMSLISFICRVRKEHPTSLATPLLVHCSAGVGRTGTFILLDLAMQQMRSQGTLSVFQHLKNLRTQRMKLVQTQV